MKLKLGMTLLAAALLARASNKSELVALHHISADEVKSMFGMNGFPGNGVSINSAPNGSVLVAGPEEAVIAAEAIIKQADVPRPDVDLTVYMVVAAPKEAAGKSLPSELDPVVKQLRSVFPYKSYTLLESSFIRVSGDNGRGSTDGYLPVHNPGELPTNYKITVSRVRVTSGDAKSSGDAEPSVHIEQFELRLNTPKVKTSTDNEGKTITFTQDQNVNLNTNVDMRVGQKIVVGKSNIDGSDAALIVVLTAKLEN